MLNKEEKQLKEAMKILLRDGKNGRLFEAAKERYVNLSTDERHYNLAHELEGIDWTKENSADRATIESMIKEG
jgi:hypothetical protein